MKRRNNKRAFNKSRKERDAEERFSRLESWSPKTEIGKKVKSGEITDMSQIIKLNKRIMEDEIIDTIFPTLESDFINIGQSKGKFGGGKRRIFRQTQKKTKEGNKPIFTVMAVVGNRNGYVGIGYGKSKETLPAKEKAVRNAKLNIIQIGRGCGSWECGCGTYHSIPFKVESKTSSVELKLMPAPKGTGLQVDKEVKKVLEFAGVRDVWSKTKGQTGQKMNLISACIKSLKNLSKTKLKNESSALVKFGAIQ